MKIIVVEDLVFKTIFCLFDADVIITFRIQPDKMYFISCFYLLI
jgi:hypothetical protein